MTESNLGKLCHDARQKHTFGGPQSSFLTEGGSGSIPTHFVIPKRYNQTFSCQTNRLKGHAVAWRVRICVAASAMPQSITKVGKCKP